jgi:hypothetical protein
MLLHQHQESAMSFPFFATIRQYAGTCNKNAIKNYELRKPAPNKVLRESSKISLTVFSKYSNKYSVFAPKRIVSRDKFDANNAAPKAMNELRRIPTVLATSSIRDITDFGNLNSTRTLSIPIPFQI